MARGRMISKAISLDEKVNSLSDDTARLLFTWLIPHLDCEGRQHGDAVTIKSIVFPRRRISHLKVEKYLKEMEKLELIFRYSVNGNEYLCAPSFEKHQIGLQKTKEAQSQIPPFTPELLQSEVGLSHLQGEGEVETKVEVKEERSSKKEDVDISNKFEVFWKAYPKRKSKGQAEKVFIKLNPDKKLFEKILGEIEKAKKADDWQKDDGKFIPHPATWLNARGWEDEYIERKGVQGGAHRGHNQPPPDGRYTRPEDYRISPD